MNTRQETPSSVSQGMRRRSGRTKRRPSPSNGQIEGPVLAATAVGVLEMPTEPPRTNRELLSHLVREALERETETRARLLRVSPEEHPLKGVHPADHPNDEAARIRQLEQSCRTISHFQSVLLRIEAGEDLPTVCFDCGLPIDEARLNAMTGCRTCYRCQEKREAVARRGHR